jgi:hypothetical protein
MRLRDKIRACNKYFTWSKEQIADFCKVSVETVQKILREKNGRTK